MNMMDLSVAVAAGADRFQAEHQSFGLKPIDFKVAARDTDGRFFVVENGDNHRGGPPCHEHHERPAGQMATSFEESSVYDTVPPPDVLAALFERNGMTVAGQLRMVSIKVTTLFS